MKVSRLGINMYEESDTIDTVESMGSAIGIAVNKLRIEINKIAQILDDITGEPVKPVYSADGKRCGACGDLIKYNHKFCPYCGKEVLTDGRSVQVQPDKDP